MEGHTNHKMTCLIVLFNFRGPTVTQSITGRVRYKNHASMFLITPTPPCFPPTWSTWSVPKVPSSYVIIMFTLHVPTSRSCSYAAWDCSMFLQHDLQHGLFLVPIMQHELFLRSMKTCTTCTTRTTCTTTAAPHL